MAQVPVGVSLSQALFDRLENERKKFGQSRSEFLRAALIDQFKRDEYASVD